MPHTIFILLLKTSCSSQVVEKKERMNKVYNNNNKKLLLFYINKSIRFAYFIINETGESITFLILNEMFVYLSIYLLFSRNLLRSIVQFTELFLYQYKAADFLQK